MYTLHFTFPAATCKHQKTNKKDYYFTCGLKAHVDKCNLSQGNGWILW